MMTRREEQEFIKKSLDVIKERLNRRTVQRLQAEFPFTYKIQGQRSVFNGLCINISSFGMAFSADTILRDGEKLLFNFKLNQENIVIPGEVSRADGKEASAEFNLPEEERERFVRLFNQEIIRENSLVRIRMTDIKKRIE